MSVTGIAVGVTGGAGNGGLQTAELSLDNGAVMVELSLKGQWK